MDIRNWFQNGRKPLKRKKNQDDSNRIGSSDGDDVGTKEQGSSNSSPLHVAVPGTSKTIEESDGYHENDIGRYIGHALNLPFEKKKDLLTNPWVPTSNYGFDSDASHLKRKFYRRSLDQYTSGLVYSSRLKGVLSMNCVLFPPSIATVKGVLGSFMVRAYMKFKDIHEDCRKHISSHYHKKSTAAAKAFLENVPVDVQMQSGHQMMIEENKQILSSTISCIIFCGTHDLPLEEKDMRGFSLTF